MRPVRGGYAVVINPLIRNLLLASLALCRFTILNKGNFFSDIILKNNLTDEYELLALIQRIKEAEENEEVVFSMKDEILIYTALDITCKLFLSNLSEELHQQVEDYLQATNSDFHEVRNTLLRGAEFVRENLRKTFADNREFMNRVQLLDMILTVD